MRVLLMPLPAPTLLILLRRALVLALLCTLMSAALADPDHDRARAALQRGEIRPLIELVGLIEKDLGGRLVEIELERRGARWVYEAEVLTDAGRRVERDYDAATGAALGTAEFEDDDGDDGDDD